MLKLYSSAITTGTDLAGLAVRAAQSIRDTLAEDRRHKAVFGDDRHGLVYPIDLEKHIATGDGFPGIDPGMRLAVARIQLPHWIHPDAWRSLPRDTQKRAHTTDYGWILDQISRTWKVVRAGTRHWTHATAAGVVIGGRYDRKRDAEAALFTSSYARLWDQERRWYAGEPIDNWRPYAELLAERQASDAWRGRDTR
jgi:hypothetical protein